MKAARTKNVIEKNALRAFKDNPLFYHIVTLPWRSQTCKFGLFLAPFNWILSHSSLMKKHTLAYFLKSTYDGNSILNCKLNATFSDT